MVSRASAVGRSSRVNQEIDVAACRELGVPILRRNSGGASVVITLIETGFAGRVKGGRGRADPRAPHG